ncbi:hypothetical protein ACOJVU_15910 [Mycobacterium sp. THU-M104]|uniref:hypothetical protein n=1 Tax=Mycobacterium sp. THU-M104 TaxID=3410515 RepID=UPI003B9DBB15
MNGTSTPMASMHANALAHPWSTEALRGLDGAITLYAELRVTSAQHTALLAAIDALGVALRGKPSFLQLSLKQMSGDSTMVKNYPESYKGVLATAYLDGAEAGVQPYFYSLFIRFADAASASVADLEADFATRLQPLLHAGVAPQSPELAAYRAVYQTVGAGDRHGIYTTAQQIEDFLRAPLDQPERDTVTVENHVMINDTDREAWEPKVMALLEVAQNTFEPQNDPAGMGQAGTRDNRLYRRALSTEILRNAHADGGLRAYIFHGLWESVWDHENSHIDTRLIAAAGPVGAAVVVGPVEPFYLTRRLTRAV